MKRMKTLFVLLLMGILGQADAQKTVEGMVKAEQSFAAYSVKNGTRAAFLQFMDSTAVVFEKGEAVNALKSWTRRGDGPGRLDWRPVVAELSASKDFGFTAGRWDFRMGPTDTALAEGQFITVWSQDRTGAWKWIVDIGVDGAPPFRGAEKIRFRDVPKTGPGQLEDVLRTGQIFIESFNRRGARAYADVLSADSYLHRNGALTAGTPEDRERMIAATPTDLRFEITGSGISRAGDLAYTYGTLDRAGKRDAFLQIWRKEGDRWMLAVEVLRY